MVYSKEEKKKKKKKAKSNKQLLLCYMNLPEHDKYLEVIM